MSHYALYSSPPLFYDYDDSDPAVAAHTQLPTSQAQAYGVSSLTLDAHDNLNNSIRLVQAPHTPILSADHPTPSWNRYTPNVTTQTIVHSTESSLAHALGDLHVSHQPYDTTPDPNNFFDYQPRPRYDVQDQYSAATSAAATAVTFPVAVDPVSSMEAAPVSCAEYGESQCSETDFPYATIASPLTPYDAASPFTEVIDSPTDYIGGSFAHDTIQSPIHYDARSFDRPVVPTRSYTLEQAVTLTTPPPCANNQRSSSLADTRRSSSVCTSQSDSPPSTLSTTSSTDPKPSSPLGAPSPIPAPSGSSQGSGSSRSRGRPRKRQATLDACKDPSSPARVVDYPFPKFDNAGPKLPNQSLSDNTKRIAPKPDEYTNTVPTPTVLSMDEIPIPDAESKPGQAIFKLNTPPEAKEKPKKKPILACLFCRERKIACGQPLPGSTKCNQCARRGLDCEFPKESRRGQHKRGPRATRVAELTEAALSAKRPIEPAPSTLSTSASNTLGTLHVQNATTPINIMIESPPSTTGAQTATAGKNHVKLENS